EFDKSLTTALAYGEIEITQASIEPEQLLKLTVKPGSNNANNPFKNLIPIKAVRTKFDRGGVNFRLYFEHPETHPTKFNLVEGTVNVTLPTAKKEILVKNLFEQVGKPPADPDLKKAGFEVSRKNDRLKDSWMVTFSTKARVAGLTLVGSDGQRLFGAAPVPQARDVNGATSFWLVSDGRPFPPKMGAIVMLYTDHGEVSFPFRFENVPIPAPPDGNYVPGIPWRLSSAKKTPEELVVDASLRWKPGYSFGNQITPPELRLDVDVTGPDAQNVVGLGFRKLDKATTNTGTALASKNSDATDKFFRPGFELGLTHYPPNGVLAEFKFEPNQPPFTSLEAASGSFKLLLGQERKSTTINKLATQLGKPISNADLKAAGLEIKISASTERKPNLLSKGETLDFEVTKGNSFTISKVQLIRRSDFESEEPHFSFNQFAANLGNIELGENKLRPTDSLEITYYTSLQEIEVPFAFEKLVVPPLPVTGK
ncbi:MAG: hypothetical protein JWM11_7708, partial [Planctomycetaceae bacterium]|nr:hypothetical protein [Planctomycetaceae bacterium]